MLHYTEEMNSEKKGKTASEKDAAGQTMNEKTAFYDLLCAQLSALLQQETRPITIYANAAALLYHQLPNVSWAGFYLYDPTAEELYLGPFQGKSACMHIPMGNGVCGTCAATRKIQRVDDVHRFPGHIACDSASNSEIVLPLIKKERLLGVLDLDSTSYARFDERDAQGLQRICQQLTDRL